MNKFKILIFYFSFFFFAFNLNASSHVRLDSVEVDVRNKLSLQKGARIFFDYCQGCHSLKYIRYSDLAQGIGFEKTKEKSLEMVIRENLMHSIDKIGENNSILSSISKENGTKWFGKVPPDLSLVSKYRGSDWLYTYMRSFYKDTSRPWGVNNLVFPDVGMPHILLKYQGLQVLKDVYEQNESVEKMFDLSENGLLSKNEYNSLVKDLVNFLSYVGEPTQIDRSNLGLFVLVYLTILVILCYYLKREYWNDLD